MWQQNPFPELIADSILFRLNSKLSAYRIGRNKEQRRRNKITCITFLLFFLYFRFMTSKDVFEITKPLT